MMKLLKILTKCGYPNDKKHDSSRQEKSKKVNFIDFLFFYVTCDICDCHALE